MVAKEKVSLIQCENYDEDIVLEKVRESLNLLGGIQKIVKPGNRVLLKVNLVQPFPPEKAVTTHPSIVRAIISLIKEARGIPVIGESSGPPGVTKAAFRKTGMKEIAERTNTEILNFEGTGTDVIRIPKGKILKRILPTNTLSKFDLIFSLPKLKAHELLMYTGAVKNFLGIIPGGGKAKLHSIAKTPDTLAHALLDIYQWVKPHFALMDAIIGMEGAGASTGTPVSIGYILAGFDCVAVDTIASALVGYNPEEILTIKYAVERKIGVGRLKQIQVLGTQLQETSVNFEKTQMNGFLNFMSGLLESNRVISKIIKRLNLENRLSNIVIPIILNDKCKKCGICARSCPMHVISQDKKKNYIIDRDSCIKCYCCHELCPNKAVKLNITTWGKLVYRFQGYEIPNNFL